MPRNSSSLVSKAILALGAAFLIATFFICNNIRTFKASATETTGTVVDLVGKSSSYRGRHTTTYAPVVFYEDKFGDTHRYELFFSSDPPIYDIGEKVDVYYDPHNPENVELGGWGGYIPGLIAGGIGLVLTLAGLITLLVQAFRRAHNSRLKQSGQLVQADFDRVETDLNSRTNGKQPFWIYCNWKDPLTGTIYSFKSTMLLFDPSSYMPAHQKLGVYLDRNNPKKYFMDTSFLDA